MSDQSPHKKLTPSKKCDSRYSFPAPYVSFNPELLDDPHWNLRDLHKLCTSLNIPVPKYQEFHLSPVSEQKCRDLVVDRLRQWHKTPMRQQIRRRKGTTNFSLLQVDVPLDSPPPMAPGTAGRGPTVDKVLLSPLKSRARQMPDGSPVSILRRLGDRCSPARRLAIEEGQLTSPSDPTHTDRRIKISIFNGTKIIPPRPEIYNGWLSEAGINPDEDSDDDFDLNADSIDSFGSAMQQVDDAAPIEASQPQAPIQPVQHPHALTPAKPVQPTAQGTAQTTQSTSVVADKRAGVSFADPQTPEPVSRVVARQQTPGVINALEKQMWEALEGSQSEGTVDPESRSAMDDDDEGFVSPDEFSGDEAALRASLAPVTTAVSSVDSKMTTAQTTAMSQPLGFPGNPTNTAMQVESSAMQSRRRSIRLQERTSIVLATVPAAGAYSGIPTEQELQASAQIVVGTASTRSLRSGRTLSNGAPALTVASPIGGTIPHQSGDVQVQQPVTTVISTQPQPQSRRILTRTGTAVTNTGPIPAIQTKQQVTAASAMPSRLSPRHRLGGVQISDVQQQDDLINQFRAMQL